LNPEPVIHPPWAALKSNPNTPTDASDSIFDPKDEEAKDINDEDDEDDDRKPAAKKTKTYEGKSVSEASNVIKKRIKG